MFECKVCRLSVNSQEQLTQHLSGKAHRKKLKAQGHMEAGLDATFDPPPVMQTDPLNLQQCESQTVNTPAPKKRKLSGDSEAGICALCNVIFNSTQQAEQHFSGSKHIKRKKLVIGADTTTESNSESGAHHCGYCMIQVNSAEQMEIHKQGKKHRENVERMSTYPVSYSETNTAVPNTSQSNQDNFAGSWKNKYKPKEASEVNCQFTKAGMLYCGFCKIQVNSMEQLDIHRQGAKHKKILDKIKATPVTYPSVKPAEKTPIEAKTELPPFESYLTTFVKSSTTETTAESHLS